MRFYCRDQQDSETFNSHFQTAFCLQHEERLPATGEKQMQSDDEKEVRILMNWTVSERKRNCS